MTDAPPLRFALAGCGGIADTHARALAALPEARLTTCCDVVPEAALAFAEKFGLRALPFDEAMREVDAVTVCTPSGLHGEVAAAALRAGRHVIIEKPMDVTTAACDALLEAQRLSGKRLAVISQHRFDPATILARETIDRGDLGGLFLVDARIPWFREQSYYDSGDWRGTWRLDGGGCLMNQGVHTADLMRWLAGPVTSVYARMKTAAHDRIEVEDALVASLTFENGAIGTLVASTAMYPGFPARLGLHGREGSLVIEGDRLHTLAIKGRKAHAREDATAHALQVASGGTASATAQATALDDSSGASLVWGDAHRRQFADFIRCCHTGEQPVVDGHEGRKAVELVCAIYESARSGLLVEL